MTSTQHPPQIDLPMDAIAVFCQRWHITELALFGSVLRGDFGPDSDIDVLVTFAPEYRYTLAMEQELASILGREIDQPAGHRTKRKLYPPSRHSHISQDDLCSVLAFANGIDSRLASPPGPLSIRNGEGEQSRERRHRAALLPISPL
jgi:predicted nucleotidyltransferase